MKRILVFALVLALLLTFACCTGDGKDKSTNEKETSDSSAGKTESVTDAPPKTAAPGSDVSQQQTAPPETSAAGSDITRPGTDTLSSTEQTIGQSETGSSDPVTTNTGTDTSSGTEPPAEPTGTDPAESDTPETDHSGGLELPIDHFG